MTGDSTERFVLRVYSDGGYAEYRVPSSGQLLVGREEGCDVRIDDQSVSRRHARLLCGERQVEIEDLGAQNVTRLNGRPLMPGRRERLQVSEVLRFGESWAVMQEVSAPALPRVYSYGYFANRVMEELERGGELTLARLPLPLGTPDRALRAALGSILRPSDLCGQYGPGELQLLFRTGEDDARARMNQLAVALQLSVDGRWVTASYPEDAKTAAMLIGRIAPLPPRAVEIPKMLPRGLTRIFEELAQHSAPLLLLGEYGVGKAAAAQYIHEHSPHREQPFLQVSGDRPPEQLAQMLQQEGMVLVRDLERVPPPPYKARLVIANVSAPEGFEGTVLEIPPLRQRRDELDAISESFVAMAAKARNMPAPRISSEALATIRKQAWPGNQPQLKNALERAVFVCMTGVITADLIPGEQLALEPLARAMNEPDEITDPSRTQKLNEDRERVVAALEAADGNQTKAAATLGISRRTLVKRIEEYGLPRPRKR